LAQPWQLDVEAWTSRRRSLPAPEVSRVEEGTPEVRECHFAEHRLSCLEQVGLFMNLKEKGVKAPDILAAKPGKHLVRGRRGETVEE
jgi:hypothetical protein